MDQLERDIQLHQVSVQQLIERVGLLLSGDAVSESAVERAEVCILDFISSQQPQPELDSTVSQLRYVQKNFPETFFLEGPLAGLLHFKAFQKQLTEVEITAALSRNNKRCAFALAIQALKFPADQSRLQDLVAYHKKLPVPSEEQLFLGLVLCLHGVFQLEGDFTEPQQRCFREQIEFVSTYDWAQLRAAAAVERSAPKLVRDAYAVLKAYITPEEIPALVQSQPQIEDLLEATVVMQAVRTAPETFYQLAARIVTTQLDKISQEWTESRQGAVSALLALPDQQFEILWKSLPRSAANHLETIKDVQYRVEKLFTSEEGRWLHQVDVVALKPLCETKSLQLSLGVMLEGLERDFCVIKFGTDYLGLSNVGGRLALLENATVTEVDAVKANALVHITMQITPTTGFTMLGSQSQSVFVYVDGVMKAKTQIKFKNVVDQIKLSNVKVFSMSLSDQMMPLISLKQQIFANPIEEPQFDSGVANLLVKQHFKEDGFTLPDLRFKETQALAVDNYKHDSLYSALKKQALKLNVKTPTSVEIFQSFAFQLALPSSALRMIYCFGESAIDAQAITHIHLDSLQVVGKQKYALVASSVHKIRRIEQHAEASESVERCQLFEEYFEAFKTKDGRKLLSSAILHEELLKYLDGQGDAGLFAFYLATSGPFFGVNVKGIYLLCKAYTTSPCDRLAQVLREVLLLLRQRCSYLNDESQSCSFAAADPSCGRTVQDMCAMLQGVRYDAGLKGTIQKQIQAALGKIVSMYHQLSYCDATAGSYEEVYRLAVGAMRQSFREQYNELGRNARLIRCLDAQVQRIIAATHRFVPQCPSGAYSLIQWGLNNPCEMKLLDPSNLIEAVSLCQVSSPTEEQTACFKALQRAKENGLKHEVFLQAALLFAMQQYLEARLLPQAVDVLLKAVSAFGLQCVRLAQTFETQEPLRFVIRCLVHKLANTPQPAGFAEGMEFSNDARAAIKAQITQAHDEIFQLLIELLKVCSDPLGIAFTLNATGKPLIRSQMIRVHLHDTVRRFSKGVIEKSDPVIDQLIKDGIDVSELTRTFKALLQQQQSQQAQIQKVDHVDEAACVLLVAKESGIRYLQAYVDVLGGQLAQICFLNEEPGQAAYLEQLLLDAVKSGDQSKLEEFFTEKSKQRGWELIQSAVNQYKIPSKQLIDEALLQSLQNCIKPCGASNYEAQSDGMTLEVIKQWCQNQIDSPLIFNAIASFWNQREAATRRAKIVAYGRVSDRESHWRQQVFPQALTCDDSIQAVIKEHLDEGVIAKFHLQKQLRGSYFVKDVIAAFQVQRALKGNMKDEDGVFLFSKKSVCYVPGARLAAKQPDDDADFAAILSQAFQDLALELRQTPCARQNCTYLLDPALECEDIEQTLLRTVVIQKEDVQAIIPRFKAHRESGIEILTSHGYAIGLEFVDDFTSKALKGSILQAELARGLFLYLCFSLYNMGALAEFYFKPSILHYQLPYRVYSFSDQVLVAPNATPTEEIKKQLARLLRSSVTQYQQTYKELMLATLGPHVFYPAVSDYSPQIFEPLPPHKVLRLLSQTPVADLSQKSILGAINASIGQKNQKKNGDAANGKVDFREVQHSVAEFLIELYVSGAVKTQPLIMYMNQLSSRSPTDLQAYPLFPLLRNRDMSHPVFTQLESRFTQYQNRFNQLLETVPKGEKPATAMFCFNHDMFYSGTFPSNGAVVAHFLIREQPYASVIIDLQNGKFDVADRMHHSYQCLYDNVFTNGQKEHVQQILFSLRMHLNLFNFDLGTRQNGKRVDDLDLSDEQSDNKADECGPGMLATQQGTVEALDLPEFGEEKDEPLDIPQAPASTQTTQAFEQPDENPVSTSSEKSEAPAFTHANHLQIMLEAATLLETSRSRDILTWLHLFFGVNRGNIRMGNLYPNSVYRFTIHEPNQNIAGELDRTVYFGVAGIQLLNGTEKIDALAPAKLQKRDTPSQQNGVQIIPRLVRTSRVETPFMKTTLNARPGLEYLPYKILKGQVTIGQLHTITHEGRFLRVFVNGEQRKLVDELMLSSFIQQIWNYKRQLIVVTNEYVALYATRIAGEKITLIRHHVIEAQIAAQSISQDSGLLFLVTRQGALVVWDLLNVQRLYERPLAASQMKTSQDDWLFVRQDRSLKVLSSELIEVGHFDVSSLYEFLDWGFAPMGDFWQRTICCVWYQNVLAFLGFDRDSLNAKNCTYEAIAPQIARDQRWTVAGPRYEWLGTEHLLNYELQRQVLSYGDFSLGVQRIVKFEGKIAEVCPQDAGEIGVLLESGESFTVLASE